MQKINPNKGLPFVPEFVNISDSLGKSAAVQTTVTMSVANTDQLHKFYILGNAVGAITIQNASLNTSDITYSIKFNTAKPDFLKNVLFYYPRIDSAEINSEPSSFIIVASRDSADSGGGGLGVPLGYEIVITIPPRFRGLHVTAHSASRVSYGPDMDHGKRLPKILLILDKFDIQKTKASDALDTLQTPHLIVDPRWFVDEMSVVKRSQIQISRTGLPTGRHWFGEASTSVYSSGVSPEGSNVDGVDSSSPSMGDNGTSPKTMWFTFQAKDQGLVTVKNVRKKVRRIFKWDELVDVCTRDNHDYDEIHWESDQIKDRWNRFVSP